MIKNKGYELLKEKVPDFKSTWKSFLIYLIWILYFLLCIFLFLWMDNIVLYGALISQFIIALICSAFSYAHMKYAKTYRKKYQELAYRSHHFTSLLQNGFFVGLDPIVKRCGCQKVRKAAWLR